MRRSKTDLLPPKIRAELDARLVANAFSGYEELAEWLRSLGYSISRGPLQKHGAALKRKLESISNSTKAALAIAEAVPDAEDVRSAAVMSLVQTEIFEIMVALQDSSEDPMERMKVLSRVAAAVSDLSRASIAQKRWADEVKAKLGKTFDELEGDARSGKAPKDPLELLRRVREEIYGIV